MRKTLRRSCAACAKAKHSCDLQTPKCSRCVKRKCDCSYANEPLTWASSHNTIGNGLQISPLHARRSGVLNRSQESISPDVSDFSMSLEAHLLDPFDSYPSNKLPRLRVQSLMQHFLSKIAFQYYPLDLSPASNPFVTSWWPLALTDPALFHVTLQTASLDDELHAMKGFPHSELLMKDSVSLLRHKVQHESLAFQDATMNAVVTLAAIEHGKGNLDLSQMHIDGVKRMVRVRGGLTSVKQTSPLTARMVAWVSLLVTGSPQFETQDDFGVGDGVSTISQWHCQPLVENESSALLEFESLSIDPSLAKDLSRLRSIFLGCEGLDGQAILSTNDLHDLTCFMLHRLLGQPPLERVDSHSFDVSECLRYGVAIYMLTIHGPTYYSHAHILDTLVRQLKYYLNLSASGLKYQDSLAVWLLSVGLVGSQGTIESHWFHEKSSEIAGRLGFRCWDDVIVHLESVIWARVAAQALFQRAWEDILRTCTVPRSDTECLIVRG